MASSAYWIDKLKTLFKEEKIEEEDDESQQQKSSSPIDTQQFQDLSDDEPPQMNSREEISFLENPNPNKEQNRKIYEKIANAFEDENQTKQGKDQPSEEDEEEFQERRKQTELERKQKKKFEPEYQSRAELIKIPPTLDIVEMNDFDRIKLYQDHTIFQKVYKKLWYIKSQIINYFPQNLSNFLLFESLINYVCLKIIKSSQFETLSLLVIAFNSVLLATDDPTTDSDNNGSIDLALLIIYTIEMVIKILALGFILENNSYMRDAWNIIDIVIIVTGYLPYVITGASFNLSALRSLRVLRPLKSVTKIKALKQLLTALFSAIPLLKDSIIILAFFFVIFGIGGLQLFTGQLKSRCIDPSTGIQTGDDGSNVIVCAQDPDCSAYSNNGISYVCGKSMISPFYDTIQFDTFGWSVLDVYVVVSLEGWTVFMNLMEDGFSIFSVFYFFLAVYIGSFFLMNLTMAIIGVKYSESIKDLQEKVIKVEEEPGYDMKQLIEWGIYKSNKIYYLELEQDKKIKRSLFSFSFSLANVLRSTTSKPVKMQPQTSKDNQTSEEVDNVQSNTKQQLIPAKYQNVKDTSKISESKSLIKNNIPQQNNEEAPFQSELLPKSNQTIIFQKNHQEKQDPPQPRKPVTASITFGSSLQNLKQNTTNKTKILQKKINQIEPQKNQFPLNVKGVDEVIENISLDQGSKNYLNNSKSHQKDSGEATQIIPPHLLVGQLEQINLKNNQKELSRHSSSRPRQREGTEQIDSPLKTEEEKKLLLFKDVKQANQNNNGIKKNNAEQDQWMNDDFLKAVDQKEIQNKIENQVDNKEKKQIQDDNKIEENYLSQVPIEQLKQKKALLVPIKQKINDHKRSSVPNVLTQKINVNLNNFKSSKTINKSQTRGFTKIENLSDDSDISFNDTQTRQKMKNQSQAIVFKDAEFMKVFRQQKQNTQQREGENKKKTSKKQTQFNEEPSFKRSESRNINKTVQVHQNVDDNFDIKKEETLLLLDEKFLKARVNYHSQEDYVDEILPMKKIKIKEKKRAAQHEKLRRLHFLIDYSNSKTIQKKKNSSKLSFSSNQQQFKLNLTHFIIQLEKTITIPVFRASRINRLIQINNFEIINMNSDQTLKVQEISKKISVGEERNDQGNDNLSFNQNNLNKQNINGDISLQQQQSQQVDVKVIQMINLPKNDDQEFNEQKYNSPLNLISDKKQEGFDPQTPKQNGENFAFGYANQRSSLVIPSTIRMLKSRKSDSKREDEIDNGAIAKSKMNYYSNKSLRGSEKLDKKLKKKEEKDIKWNYQLAISKIFEDEGQNQIDNKQGNEEEFNFLKNNKSIQKKLEEADNKTKDHEKYSSSSMIDQEFQSSSSLTNNQNAEKKLNENKEDEQNSFNIPFAIEGIEQEFMKIRRREIFNIEKKGINIISTEWSGENVIPTTLIQKSQRSVDRMLNSINHTKYDQDQNEGGIVGIIQAIRRRMKWFAHTGFFENSILICVIFNTIILSLDGYVTDSKGLQTMSQANTAFTIIFTVDMGLKVIGEGLIEYVSDKMNIFDGFIVCLSLFEMIFLTGSGSSFSAFRAVRILRVFRVLRVTRLIRSLQFMKLMISALSSAISQFVYILLLLFLFMFIYILLGMSIFGGGLYINDKPTRANFDSFFNAGLSVLQLLTMENWNDILSVCIRSNDVNNYISVIYLISWLFMGNYVFMNLVLAIIMDSFDSADVQEEKKDMENFIEVVADLDLEHQSTNMLNLTSGIGSQFSNPNLNKSEQSLAKGLNQQNENQSQKSNEKRQESPKPNEEKDDEEDEEENKKKQQNKQKQFVYFQGVMCKQSFYIFSQQNIFRRVIYRIYKHPLFDQSILVAILLSSLKLTIDTYVEDQTSTIYAVGLEIDKVFTAIFAFESVVKMVSLGLIMEEGSYLRDEWSQLDMFIVICSLIDVSVSSIDLSAIKILRLLRTLRPLRLLNHNKSMKLIVTALMESVGGISNMIAVVILIWLMFAILGLNLMKGKLQYCNFSKTVTNVNYDLYTYHEEKCNAIKDAKWQTYDINCDNIGNSMLFLFILSSFEAWPNYIYQFLDADESGPIHSQSVYFAAYFAVFIFIGGFFSINLFSAIMAFNFDIAQSKAKNQYLTDQQSQWIELQRLIIKSTPDFASMKQPSNRFRFLLWKIVTSPIQEIFIIFCILLNIISMAMAYDTSPSSYDEFLTNINYGFTAVFICECILKIIAFGPTGYFFNSWNKFDFFVVVASIVDIITSQMGKQLISFLKSGPQIIRVMRVMRVSRLLKLIKSFQNLQKLIQTTIFALPKLMNATALLLLFYFIFSILACYLFANVIKGDAINHLNNFQNFHSAFIILFRCSTGEDWPSIMFDVVKQTQAYSIIFFILFIISQSYIMMNLFVLIIMNEFEENYIDPDNPLQNFREQEESFKSLWVAMTFKEAGIKIHERFLTDFYFDLPLPLGYDYNQKNKQFIENLKIHNKNITDKQIQQKSEKFKTKQKQEADKHIMQMNIFCDYDGFIYFNELFFFFFKFSLEEKINEYDLSTKAMQEKYLTALQIVHNEEVISLKKIAYLKKKQSNILINIKNQKRKECVNPMVRRLFVGMAFSSWVQYSKITQKKINQMNFNGDDISSESDTDSDAEDQLEQSDFLKGEDDGGGILFRPQKKEIILREHTVINRQNVKKEREANNLIEQDKYIFLPNTEIYKDDYVQLGLNPDYYSEQVFSSQNSEVKKPIMGKSDDLKKNNPNQNQQDNKKPAQSNSNGNLKQNGNQKSNSNSKNQNQNSTLNKQASLQTLKKQNQNQSIPLPEHKKQLTLKPSLPSFQKK